MVAITNKTKKKKNYEKNCITNNLQLNKWDHFMPRVSSRHLIVVFLKVTTRSRNFTAMPRQWSIQHCNVWMIFLFLFFWAREKTKGRRYYRWKDIKILSFSELWQCDERPIPHCHDASHHQRWQSNLVVLLLLHHHFSYQKIINLCESYK